MTQFSNLIDLTGVTESFLPNVKTNITREVWRRVAGSDFVDLEDERARELGVYLSFAVIGIIGCDQIRTDGCETILIPVAFDTGWFDVMVTISHRRGGPSRIILSLPDESLRPGSQ